MTAGQYFVFSSTLQFLPVALIAPMLAVATQTPADDNFYSIVFQTIVFTASIMACMFALALVVLTTTVIEKLGDAGIDFSKQYLGWMARVSYMLLIFASVMYGLTVAVASANLVLFLLISLPTVVAYVAVCYVSIKVAGLVPVTKNGNNKE